MVRPIVKKYCPVEILLLPISDAVTEAPSPSLPSLKGISRHHSEELSHFFQGAPAVRTEATITAATKRASEQFFNRFSRAMILKKILLCRKPRWLNKF
jgi:hypothetical protein